MFVVPPSGVEQKLLFENKFEKNDWAFVALATQ